jgi:uncharacterized protein YeaO (DUF488 family)
MSISIVRLGTPRKSNEGLRIATVRRPPRGVPKSQFAKLNYYDVWLPTLSPSQQLVSFAQHSKPVQGAQLSRDDDRSWKIFERKFRAEMNKPDAARLLDLLAALSHHTNFAIGCYCEDESRCHRSILRKLLTDRSANISA